MASLGWQFRSASIPVESEASALALSEQQREMLHLRRQLLGLLRDGGWFATVLFSVVQLVQVVLPALTALATAAVVNSVGSTSSGSTSRVVVPLVLLASTLIVAQVLSAIQLPAMLVVQSRIDVAYRERLADLTSRSETITVLEQPAVQDLIATANAEPSTWIEKTPGQGATSQLMLMVRYVGLVSSALVLVRFSWWLVPLLVLPAFAYRYLALRQWLNHFRIWARGISHHRRYQYWSKLSFAPAEGKEIRVFGLDDWISGTGQNHSLTHMRPVWEDDYRAARAKWLQSVLLFVPLVIAFLTVCIQTEHGRSSLATETVVLTAAWATFQAVGYTFDSIAVQGVAPVMKAYDKLTAALAGTGRPRPTRWP